MAQDKNRTRKTYSFFRPPPILASGGGGGGGGGCCTPELWFSTTDDAIYTTGSVLIRGADATDAAQDYGTDTWFFVSGSIAGKGSERKVSAFGGDVVVSGSLTAFNGLSGSLTQLPDGTSYLIAGIGIDIVSASNGAVTISSKIGGGDVYTDDFVDGNLNPSNILVVNHNLQAQYVNVSVYDENDKLIIPDEAIATAPGTIEIDLTSFRPLPGTWHVFVASGQAPGYEQYWFSTTAGSIFTSGSAALVGDGDEWGVIDSPSDKGADVFFYVSGSISGTGVEDKKSLFGGDVVISGSLKVGTGSITITSNDVQWSGYTTRIEKSGNDMKFYDVNVPAGATLSSLIGNAPASPVNSVQYNDAGAFGGSANFTFIPGAGAAKFLRLTGSLENGYQPIAGGDYSHAEGYETNASGDYSHAEGEDTGAAGYASHAEGKSVVASGDYSHAEGSSTTSLGNYSHAEGDATSSEGDHSHAEGNLTIAQGVASHAEGESTKAQGDASHAEGLYTLAASDYSHAEGHFTTASALYSHAEGYLTTTYAQYSHAEGERTRTLALGTHAEGYGSLASANYSHAEGYLTTASYIRSHAEGELTIAQAIGAHAEGYLTLAGNGILGGQHAHAEGYGTHAKGTYSHAEGYLTTGSGQGSHAEGRLARSEGDHSHAEGFSCIAAGDYSHAEGYSTTANGIASHAGGRGTTATGDYQTVVGRWNDGNDTASVFTIGNGYLITGIPVESDLLRSYPGTAARGYVQVSGSVHVFNKTSITDAGGTTLTHDLNKGLRLSDGPSDNTWLINPAGVSGITFSNSLVFSNNTSDTLSTTSTIRGYLAAGGGSWTLMNFTGQHRCLPTSGSVRYYADKTGLIVSAAGKYSNPIVEENITINDSTPTIQLSIKRNDKKVLGVISNIEDVENGAREFGIGNFVSVAEANPDDSRLFINSLGEGAVWVCNINGSLENGDYVTTCEIPGMGMKQDDDLLHNYTVAKITCDCDFDLNSTLYRCEEFEHEGVTYRRAFVGCTYHCG